MPSRGDGVHVEIGHVARAHLDPAPRVADAAAIIGGHHRGGGDQLAAGKRRAGEAGDGGAVVAAAEDETRRAGHPPQPAGHRLAEHAPIRVDIIGFVAALMRRIGMRLPVASLRHRAIGADRHHGRGGDAVDAVGCVFARRNLVHQYTADLRIGQPMRHIGKRAQRVRVAGKDQAVRVAVIENGALAHVIAAEHEFFRASVPDGEGEVAEEVCGAVIAPFLVGQE